jgi:hypothetical protein
LVYGSAQAQGVQVKFLEDYRYSVRTGVFLCGLTLKNELALRELVASGAPPPANLPQGMRTFAECADEWKLKARKDYGPALKALRTARAQSALKNVHVAFVSALEGLAPEQDELRVLYAQRQANLTSALRDAWTRLDLEI